MFNYKKFGTIFRIYRMGGENNEEFDIIMCSTQSEKHAEMIIEALNDASTNYWNRTGRDWYADS